jgi:hypothetical protein
MWWLRTIGSASRISGYGSSLTWRIKGYGETWGENEYWATWAFLQLAGGPGRSEDIPTGCTYPENLGTAFLAGFDYTRREISRSTGDEVSGGGWRKALYQHPERFQQQGPSGQQQALRPPFIPEHDIYGLGVVLIEIGRWKPLDTYKHLFENATPLERKANLETMAEGLKVSMGRRYSEVCKRCLCILDGENRSIRDTPAIRHVLFDLEDLAAATS